MGQMHLYEPGVDQKPLALGFILTSHRISGWLGWDRGAWDTGLPWASSESVRAGCSVADDNKTTPSQGNEEPVSLLMHDRQELEFVLFWIVEI